MLFLAGGGVFQSAAQAAGSNAQVSDQLVHTLCVKRVALLGENPVHGFGETLAFKAALVRRLIDECHYNAFFIEAGTYDFVHTGELLRDGEEITDSIVSTAIGGLWANQEVGSLVPFLRERASQHSLVLGGLDDQINRGTYAQLAMPADVVRSLPAAEQSTCLDRMQQHMPWHYNPDVPDTPQDKVKILACLNRMAELLPPESNRTKSERGTADMVESLRRNFDRERAHDLTKPGEQTPWMNERDHSMYLNFRWWLSQLPPHSKIIVWSATVHTAKELNGVPGFETRKPLGSYIRQDFGNTAFSLGFSAYSGSYWLARPPAHELPTAPETSLERRSLAHSQSEAVYLSRKQLQAAGTIAARPLGTSFTNAAWDKVLDGLVIFREERTPTQLKP